MMICGVLIFRERLALAQPESNTRKSLPALSPASPAARLDADGRRIWENRRQVRHRRARAARRAARAATASAQLEALVSRLVATPLDPSRPLWQFQLVDRYEGGSAVIVRIHHCYADGIALIQVMLSMTDDDREGAAARSRPPPSADGEASDDPLAAPVDPIAAAYKTCCRGGVGDDAKRVPRSGTIPPGLWLLRTRAARLPRRSRSLHSWVRTRARGSKGGRGVAKRVAWAEPIALTDVKAIGTRARLLDQRCPALVGRRSAAIVSRAQGEEVERVTHPRAGAGQSAAAGKSVEARQSIRPGLSRSSHRHRESRRASLRSAREHAARSRVRINRCSRSAFSRRWAQDRRCCRSNCWRCSPRTRPR